MHLAILTALLLQTALFVAISSTEELNASDVPGACSTICQPIVQLTGICDVDPRPSDNGPGENGGRDSTPETDEPIESQCICTNTSFNVSSIAALCASCIEQNANGTVDDMDDIMSACAFSSTSYAPSVTALVAQITVIATKPVTTGTGVVSPTPTGQGATQTAAVAGLSARKNPSSVFILGTALLSLAVGAGT
ncbi:hypothetical protein LTR84_011438 [Exophiala bonariae]|uniref:Protein CAP22 n=1 Tax=Exophiala bonariae TaxID=1690606 RepID=A0AAV9MUT1_9EURO|nr:hypothetical protein LTR84_011438 [Exophiala bonariae]